MARYDEITERNWLTRKEKLIQKSVNFFLGITVLDFLLIIIKPIRRYHFDNFPNFHFIGLILIFIITIARIAQAKNEGKEPYMESSREWRARKDMLGAYDFVGPGPDYSKKLYNIIYYIVVFFGMGLIIIEVVKTFW